MEIKKLTPRHGEGTYRIDESDDFVVIEDIDWGCIPSGKFYTEEHRVGLICTGGRAQFEYDGVKYTMEKNDLFLYMTHNIISNLMRIILSPTSWLRLISIAVRYGSHAVKYGT